MRARQRLSLLVCNVRCDQYADREQNWRLEREKVNTPTPGEGGAEVVATEIFVMRMR